MCVLGVRVFAVADRRRDERRWYDHCLVRLVARVLCSGHEQRCCGCGVVGSRQSGGVARWRLLTPRAWHGWCVACVVVALPGTHRYRICTGHMYIGVVVAWSGGCGSRSAAKSSGAQLNCSSLLLIVASLTWRCCGGASTGTIVESYLIIMVTSVTWRVWRRCGCLEAALRRHCVQRLMLRVVFGAWCRLLLFVT